MLTVGVILVHLFPLRQSDTQTVFMRPADTSSDFLGATLLPCTSWRLMHHIHSHSALWKSNTSLGKCNEHANVRLLLAAPAAPYSNIHWMRAQGPPGSRVCLACQFPCDHHQGCLNGQLVARMCQNFERRKFRLKFLYTVRQRDPSSSLHLNPRFSKLIYTEYGWIWFLWPVLGG